MIFITGGSGMLGSRLVYDFYLKQKKVTVLVQNQNSVLRLRNNIGYYTNNVDSVINNIDFVEGDILDYDLLNNTIEPGSFVYHCAAYVSFNKRDTNKINTININGTANIVNICLQKNVSQLCHVSSIGAIGSSANGSSITENTPWTPGLKSAYSLSKYYSELEVWRGIAEGLNAVIVNPAVMIGEGDWERGSGELFSRTYKGIGFYTLGSTGYVDIFDVSKAMIALTEAGVCGQRFILSAETLNYRMFFTKVAVALKVKPPHRYAGKTLTEIAWRTDSIVSLILCRKPLLTKNTSRIAHCSDSYDGQKIKQYITFEYTPVWTTIKRVAKAFLTNTKVG